MRFPRRARRYKLDPPTAEEALASGWLSEETATGAHAFVVLVPRRETPGAIGGFEEIPAALLRNIARKN